MGDPLPLSDDPAVIIEQLRYDNAQLWKVNARLQRKIEKLEAEKNKK